MFSLGFGEILIICVILIVVVGPERLPGLMKGVGKTMRTVREASRDLRGAIGIDEMMRDDIRPRPPVRPPPASTVSRNPAPGGDAAPAAGASGAAADASSSAPGAAAPAASANASDAASAPATAKPPIAPAVPPATVAPGSIKSPFPKGAGLNPAASGSPSAPPLGASPPPPSTRPPAIDAPPPAGDASGARPEAQQPASGDAASERKP